jgi:hypothetical protein
VDTAERKGKGKMSGGGVVWQAQPGRWRGARPLVIIINTSFSFLFPFFAPILDWSSRPRLFDCLTVVARRDKVSLDHPFHSLLINSSLSALLPIVFTPHSP